jgi:hypothetical protein
MPDDYVVQYGGTVEFGPVGRSEVFKVELPFFEIGLGVERADGGV